MTRAQCIVQRDNRLLMVQHRQFGVTWCCLPGGGVDPGETPAEAALRELREECCVDGTIIRETNRAFHKPDDDTISFLVDIGDQIPKMGSDPEFGDNDQIMVNVAWLTLSQIPERDRAFLWAAGILSIPVFYIEVSGWGDRLSYPGAND